MRDIITRLTDAAMRLLIGTDADGAYIERMTELFDRRVEARLARLAEEMGDDAAWEHETAAQNVERIAEVPEDVLPERHPLRAWLFHLAAAGEDVYCYHSGGGERGIWCAWLRDRRVPVAELVEEWDAGRYPVIVTAETTGDAEEAD